VLVVHEGEIEVGSDTSAAISVSGGGQGANTAAWLAQAGCAVTLVAAVGDDLAGRERVAELTALGVRCAVRTHAGAVTGSVVVLASRGERTMITDRGAALLLDPADVTAAIKAAPDAVHLHLSGYPLLDSRSRPGGLAALAAARERGLRTSVDAASAAPLRRVGARAFLDWVRGVDLMLCNRDEAGVLAGVGGAVGQARALTAVAENVVVKLGAEGAVWCDRAGGTWSVPGVGVPGAGVPGAGVRGGGVSSGGVPGIGVPRSEIPGSGIPGSGIPGDEVPSSGIPSDGVSRAGVPVADPTGAGDAFAAGVLAAWCRGASPAEALGAGAALGAAAVGKVGARPGR
jgi:ribokinase